MSEAQNAEVLVVHWDYTEGTHKGAKFWACHGVDADGRIRDWPKMGMRALGAAKVRVVDGEGLIMLLQASVA